MLEMVLIVMMICDGDKKDRGVNNADGQGREEAVSVETSDDDVNERGERDENGDLNRTLFGFQVFLC